jgi:site-specific DNA-cytosine methylase
MQKRPRVTVMENVGGLATQFRPLLRKVTRHLRKAGYVVSARLLNTRNHGVPQRRRRLYLVGIRADSYKRTLQWPQAVPLKRTAKSLLVRGAADARLAIPERSQRAARDHVKHTYRQLLGRGVDPRRQVVVTDIGCTPRFRVYGLNVFPCITQSRATQLGWWVSIVGRQVSLVELFRFQGFIDDAVDVDGLLGHAHEPRVTQRDIAGMVGNSMSLNVVERLLAAALWSAGLAPSQPRDRRAA